MIFHISFFRSFLLLYQVESIRAVFKKELDIPIVEIADPNAKLDGGDVLFTGKNSHERMVAKIITKHFYSK